MVAEPGWWVLLSYRMPREPSTPRIAVWRRLRQLGAAQLGDGLVALVSNGLTTALIVLGIIIVVQQLESNVLQPVLQGRSLNLHAAVVLLAVTAGGTLFGIIGAFLAVPVAAVTAAVLRYISEQISLRAGEVHADDLPTTTPEGTAAARRVEGAARQFRQLLARRNRDPDAPS